MSGLKLNGQQLINGVPNIVDVVLDFLNKNPGNFLEIGSYYGITSCKIAEQTPNNTTYIIDPFISDGHVGVPIGESLDFIKKVFLKNIKQFKNIEFFNMTTENFLRYNENNFDSYNINCIFIDGAHIYDSIKIDIETSIKLIGDKKGLIIFDDINILDVKKAVTEFKHKYKPTKYNKSDIMFLINKNNGF